MPKFYLVATPIGNLEDLSFRALRILGEVDFVLAEDTRVTRKLLDHYKITTPLKTLNQHSSEGYLKTLVELLSEGKNLALVSDAGTPGINDPGGLLVEEILKSGISVQIIPIPGPAALVTALSISGINADRFLFLGFPPHKKGRQKFFKEIADSKHPVVFYESKHRIIRTLKELSEFEEIKNRQLIVGRELTKMHETVYRGTIAETLSKIEKEQLGEFVVIVDCD